MATGKGKGKTGTGSANPSEDNTADSMAVSIEKALRATVDARQTGQHITLTVADGSVKFGLKGGLSYTFSGAESAQTFANVLLALEASGTKVQDHPGRMAFALRRGANVEIGKHGPRNSTPAVNDDGTPKEKKVRVTGKRAAAVQAELDAKKRQDALEATPEYWEEQVRYMRMRIEILTGRITEYLTNADNARKAQVIAVATEEAEAEAELSRLEAAISAQRAKIEERKSKIATIAAQIDAGKLTDVPALTSIVSIDLRQPVMS